MQCLCGLRIQLLRSLVSSRNMEPRSPDLLQAAEGQFKRQTTIISVVFMLLVASISAYGARWSYLSNHQDSTKQAQATDLPVIQDLRRLLFGTTPSTGTTTPETQEQINVLILGIGGPGHEGSNLTDSILLASINLTDHKVGLVSIPRDLAYPLGGGRFEKINSVHAYAEQAAPGEGAARTAQAFSQLLETRIDHVVRVDFQGFIKLIDAIGGISVPVETAFTDTSYPSNDPPNSWKTVSFKKGVQDMNGERALIFARSRHGNNGEGSDFARSRRQQLVMIAVRDKLLSLGTLTDPNKLADIYRVVSSHIQTDLSVWELLRFAPLAKDFSRDNITLQVLDDRPNGVLTSATVNGAYMLFPKQPDWSEVRAIVQNPFSTETARKEALRPEQSIRLEIKNGTFRTNFAAQAAAELEKNGYEITNLGNAAKRGFERTAIYDLTSGKKPAELARLQKLLQADVVSITPDQIKTDANGTTRLFPLDAETTERAYAQTTDFLLILGEASFAFVESNSYVR